MGKIIVFSFMNGELTHNRKPTMPAIKYSFGEFRIISVREPTPRVLAETPQISFDYWMANVKTAPAFQDEKEHLVIVLLNTKLETIGWNLVALGSLNECTCSPREVLRTALIGNAYGFILMHNHPSGDPMPSDADRRVTRRIREGAEACGLKMMDHVVIGEKSPDRVNPYLSFREHGLI